MQNSLGLLLNWSRKSRSDAVGSRRICRLYFIVQQGAIVYDCLEGRKGVEC